MYIRPHPRCTDCMASFKRLDRRRKAQMVEILRVMRDMRREMGDMQAELLALREQQRRAHRHHCSCMLKRIVSVIDEVMAPCDKHKGPNTPPNNTNPNNTTPESIQAMIDQALLRNSHQ
ncbi:hypothetical protein Tco_1475061 [Tanacetum coccineum]